MRLKPILFRRIHKWVGLVLGVQFLLWAVSGAMMATLDMKSVGGGEEARESAPLLPPSTGAAWPEVRRALGTVPVRGVSLQQLLDRPVLNVETPRSVRLFDAATGAAIRIDADLAREIALDAHPARPPVRGVATLDRVTLAVREHTLPIWRVDFADQANSSFYVSGASGALLERRNDNWRLWDFFWMFHTMDYINRVSFNHPLIVIVAIGAVWLALTGLYLVFKTNWRPEMRWLATPALRSGIAPSKNLRAVSGEDAAARGAESEDVVNLRLHSRDFHAR